MNETQNIRWPFFLLTALGLSALSSFAIFGPVALHQHASAVKAESVEKATRPTLQTYVEERNFSFLDEKSKKSLSLLLPYESISLERTPCYGTCPVYVVTFYKDGHATLMTDNWQDKSKKYYTGKIWIGEYARLTQMVTLAKNAARKADYADQWTDDYTAIIRAQSKDQTWTVSDYGRVAPVEVWALEMLFAHLQRKERMDSGTWALTIHSSRGRFAARLNSGVRPHRQT